MLWGPGQGQNILSWDVEYYEGQVRAGTFLAEIRTLWGPGQGWKILSWDVEHYEGQVRAEKFLAEM